MTDLSRKQHLYRSMGWLAPVLVAALPLVYADQIREGRNLGDWLLDMPVTILATLGGLAVLLEAFLLTGIILPGSLAGIAILSVARGRGIDDYAIVVAAVFSGAVAGNIASYLAGAVLRKRRYLQGDDRQIGAWTVFFMYSTAQLAGVAAFHSGVAGLAFRRFLAVAFAWGTFWGVFWAAVIWRVATTGVFKSGRIIDVLFAIGTIIILWRIIRRPKASLPP